MTECESAPNSRLCACVYACSLVCAALQLLEGNMTTAPLTPSQRGDATPFFLRPQSPASLARTRGQPFAAPHASWGAAKGDALEPTPRRFASQLRPRASGQVVQQSEAGFPSESPFLHRDHLASGSFVLFLPEVDGACTLYSPDFHMCRSRGRPALSPNESVGRSALALQCGSKARAISHRA